MLQDLQNKKGLVKTVFNKVYNKYDLMNDFMSLGIHRVWKKDLIRLMNPYKGKKLIDVACGTGDIAKIYLDSVGENEKNLYLLVSSSTTSIVWSKALSLRL